MKTAEKKVLIIGASGFIGQHTLKRLTSDGIRPYATILPSLTPPSIEGVTWIPCDITQSDVITSWPVDCESIIFLAQSPRWREFPLGAEDVFQVNVAAIFQAAEFARQHEVKRFIYASSGSIYGQNEHPATEADPIYTNTRRRFYDATKLASELLLSAYSEYFSVITLRLFSPYGQGQDPKMLIPQLVQRVREDQAIDLQGNSGMKINPVSVSDVAETLRRCLDLDKTVTFNVGGPEILTLKQIGETIGKVVGRTPRFNVHEGDRAPVIVGDISMLKSSLDWVPQQNFSTGLIYWIKNENRR